MAIDTEGVQIDADSWWAVGDTPVRADSRVSYLIDGRATMLAMCRCFITAREYIYIAAWGMTPAMKLVRGIDQRAGVDGSPEQEELMGQLHDVGFTQTDIDFWCNNDLTVQAVLGYAVSKGRDVRVLIWSSSKYFSHYDPVATQAQLEEAGVACMIDDAALGLERRPIESMHQKFAVVDGQRAFVGGVDMLIEPPGDFDRWDTPAHQIDSPLRRSPEGLDSHSWHDAHAVIEGVAVGDVENNFRERWNDIVLRSRWDPRLMVPQRSLSQPEQSSMSVQVARTIPTRTYTFAPPDGIQGIAQQYAHAFRNAQDFIYVENQYFWTHAYYSPLGWGAKFHWRASQSPDMELNLQELVGALQRGAFLAMVLPDHPNVGRLFTDLALGKLREQAPQAVKDGRLQVFCLASSSQKDDDSVVYRPIYVHAKIAVVDDVWSTVGSANLNNRGMRDDTEMNVATLNAELARNLRLALWAEHLGVRGDAEGVLNDPARGLGMMVERAWENLHRFRDAKPLIGHLLPYLTRVEAEQQGLPFHDATGWIEQL